MPTIPNNRWVYGSSGTTQNKAVSRAVTPKPSSYECVGFDGMEEGTLRPFPGLLEVARLGPTGGYSALVDGAAATGNHNHTSRLLDVFPVNFRVGVDAYAYGFVYRVKRKTASATLSDVYVDYWSSGTGTWTLGSLVKEAVPSASQMSVSVWGRFVYVFVEGAKPSMFYATASSTGVITKLGALASDTVFPGPGLRPTLKGPDRAGLVGGIQTHSPYPAQGQVVLTTRVPELLNIYPCAPGSGSGYAPSGGSGDTGGGLTAFTCCPGGGADMAPQSTLDVRMLELGSYAFAYSLYDTRTGRRSALSDIAHAQTTDFGGADKYAIIEICYDPTLYDQAYVYRSVQVEGVGTTYTAGILHLDKIITLATYATCRSPYSASIAQSVYYYQLEDKALVYQDVYTDSSQFDEAVPSAGASLMYEGTLLLGKVGRSGSPTSSTVENRPEDLQRGQGEIRYSSLVVTSPELFPPKNYYRPPIPTNEVIAFRQVGGNAIGFSRDRAYYARKDSTYIRIEQIHEGFGIAGPKALDTIGSMIYTLTPKGVKAVDSQGQLEDVKAMNKMVMEEWSFDSLEDVSMAYDPSMSALFIHNPVEEKTAILWFNSAKVTEMDDMQFMQVCRGVWPFLNDDGTTTNANTPLVERAFFVQDIPVSYSPSEFSAWKPRVYVVDKDRQRRKTIMGQTDQPACTLLPMDKDCYFTVASVEDDVLRLEAATFSDSENAALPTNVEGAYCYVISSSDARWVGQKARILRRDPYGSPDEFTLKTEITLPDIYPFDRQTTESLNDTSDLVGSKVPAGSRVVLSPIKTRWVTSPLTQQVGEQAFASEQDHFRIKHVDSLGLVMTGVTGVPLSLPAGNTDVFFRGLLYQGDVATPLATAEPRDNRGQVISNVREGESTYWVGFGIPQSDSRVSTRGRHGIQGAILVPGVELITADVDWRIVSLSVKGEIQDTLNTEKTS